MNISPAIHLAWQLASQETVAARAEQIGPVQMFCGISKLGDLLRVPSIVPELLSQPQFDDVRSEFTIVDTCLREHGVDPTGLRRALRARAGAGAHLHSAGATVHRSDVLKSLFERAALFANEAGARIELRHLLAAIAEQPHLLVTTALAERGVDLGAFAWRLRASAEDDAPSAAAPRPRSPVEAPAAATASKRIDSRPTPTLDRYGRDLSALARDGALGPVIGRRDEVLQVMQTLLRRTKSNPVLVGEAGVGKTAIAELLAIRIAEAAPGGGFEGFRVVELSIANLLSGASAAGEREKRLQAVLAECRADRRLVLFVDELHTLVKAGGVGGAVDPADIFKPALARGEIKLLGATTHDEYARYIEADPALERRFARVIVDEPSADEAFEILQGIRQSLEAHHGVTLADDVLRAAIDLSVRFDTAHQLPDKAVDVIDLASARTRLPALSAVGHPVAAGEARALPVTVSAVAAVLARKLGIPPELVLRDARAGALDGLEAHLNARVVGQTDAVARIVRRLRLSQGRLRDRRGPLAVLLFLGSTGVGKTEMVRAMAEFLFGDERQMIRLDMAEFMEEHSASKLIGSPPGYVGHEEQGQLTGALRARPHSIVLFDELDKAHPRVLDVFLQLFDEGRLTDSKGRCADGRHAIFVMTANPPPRAGNVAGFQASSGPAIDVHALGLRPEFRNRIDDAIVFRALDLASAERLVARNVADVARRVRDEHGVALHVSDDVVAALAREGFNPADGVRLLNRAFDNRLVAPLTECLLRGVGGLHLIVEGGERLEFRYAPSAPASNRGGTTPSSRIT